MTPEDMMKRARRKDFLWDFAGIIIPMLLFMGVLLYTVWAPDPQSDNCLVSTSTGCSISIEDHEKACKNGGDYAKHIVSHGGFFSSDVVVFIECDAGDDGVYNIVGGA